MPIIFPLLSSTQPSAVTLMALQGGVLSAVGLRQPIQLQQHPMAFRALAPKLPVNQPWEADAPALLDFPMTVRPSVVHPLLPVPPTRLLIAGITKDSGGVVLPSCDVRLFTYGTNVLVGQTTSNASGYYEFIVNNSGLRYFVVSYRHGVAKTLTGHASADETLAWSGIAWSPVLGLFAAVATGGTGTANAMTSPDGVTWTIRTTPAQDWNGIAWSPRLRLFAAVSATTGTTNVMTSPDGITWTSRTTPLADWRGICWSEQLGLFVAVASFGTNRTMTSPDGIVWTGHANAGIDGDTWWSVCWSPALGLFAACSLVLAGSHTHMTSPDGVTWTAPITPIFAAYYSICWADGLGLFVSAGPSLNSPPSFHTVLTSVDGVTWTHQGDLVSAQWNGMVWIPEYAFLLAVGKKDNFVNKTVGISMDSVTWTEPASADEAAAWNAVAWAPSLKVAVAVAGTGSIARTMITDVIADVAGTTLNTLVGAA